MDIATAEEIPAPRTPIPAPTIVNDNPKTSTVLVGKVKKKLPITLSTLVRIFTLIGIFVSPAPLITPASTSPVK